jgi:hypothetical protein
VDITDPRALAIDCPACVAYSGQLCVERGKPYARLHRARRRVVHGQSVPTPSLKIGNGQVGGVPNVQPGRASRRRRGSGGRTGQRYSKTPRLPSYEVPPAGDVTITRPDGSVEIVPPVKLVRSIPRGKTAGRPARRPRPGPQTQPVPIEQLDSNRSEFVPCHLRDATIDEHGRATTAGWSRNNNDAIPRHRTSSWSPH